MKPMNAEDFLADQLRQWLAADFKIPSYCAYEKRDTYGLPIVTIQSATQLCTKPLDPIDADHFDIVKPADINTDSYLAFKAAYLSEMASASRHSEPQSRVDLQSFISVLQDRAESFTSGLDEVIDLLSKSSDSNAPDANAAKLSLPRLRTEFVTLQKKHIDAVMVGNILLAHELVGKIHDVQEEVMKEVSSEVGSIGNRWAGSPSNRYLDSPPRGQDPEHDREERDYGDLREHTVDRLQALDYPGNAPASAPAEVSSLAFGK
jgi:hypothetical protein